LLQEQQVRELQTAMAELRNAHDAIQLEVSSMRSRLAMADARAKVQAGAAEQDRVKVKAAVQAARAASSTAAERARQLGGVQQQLLDTRQQLLDTQQQLAAATVGGSVPPSSLLCV
jgi:predicted  nucleic acid-binding Zn-ribbon protein